MLERARKSDAKPTKLTKYHAIVSVKNCNIFVCESVKKWEKFNFRKQFINLQRNVDVDVRLGEKLNLREMLGVFHDMKFNFRVLSPQDGINPFNISEFHLHDGTF